MSFKLSTKEKIELAQVGATEEDAYNLYLEIKVVRKKRLDSIRHLGRRLANG